MSKKYLDKEGLQRVWQKILNNFLTRNEASSLVPTTISSFENDANYVSEGDNVSSLENDANYVSEGDNVSELENDANYQSDIQVATAIRQAVADLISIGDNISELENDANYQTRSQLMAALADAIFAQDNISLLTNDANYQTLTQVTELINDSLGRISTVRFRLVDELPVVGESNIIYLVPALTTEADLEIKSAVSEGDLLFSVTSIALYKANTNIAAHTIVPKGSSDLSLLPATFITGSISDPAENATSEGGYIIDESGEGSPVIYIALKDIAVGDTYVISDGENDANIESVTFSDDIVVVSTHEYAENDLFRMPMSINTLEYPDIFEGYELIFKAVEAIQVGDELTWDNITDLPYEDNNNAYIEWYYTPDTYTWEIIGSTGVDLSNYYTKNEIQSEYQKARLMHAIEGANTVEGALSVLHTMVKAIDSIVTQGSSHAVSGDAVYTYVNNQIASRDFRLVDELPAVGESNVIYRVPTILSEDNLTFSNDVAKDALVMSTITRKMYRANKAFYEYDTVNGYSEDITEIEYDPYVDTTNTAYKNYSVGYIFFDGPGLYEVISDISIGDSFIIGTNIKTLERPVEAETITTHAYSDGDAMLILGEGYTAKGNIPVRLSLNYYTNLKRDYSIDSYDNIYVEWYYAPETKRWETIGPKVDSAVTQGSSHAVSGDAVYTYVNNQITQALTNSY